MSERERRKQRLHELLDLARVYRGWNRIQLARAVNRDPSRLYPDTDNPKFDFLMALADVLEWPLDAVGEYLWAGLSPEPPADVEPAGDFQTVLDQQKAVHLGGDYTRALELVRTLHASAKTPDERAIAWNREAMAWESTGRYMRALNAVRRGLQESPISSERRLLMQSNLANVHYGLWELDSARGISNSLLGWFAGRPPLSPRSRVTQAFSYYVRGNSYRRLASMEPDNDQAYAQQAKSDLEAARSLYVHLAGEMERDDLAGIANTCQAAQLEIAVILRERDPREAVAEVIEILEAVTDVREARDGEWLESYGWTALFGANIALRCLDGNELQRSMAVLLNKVLEIADYKGNWAFRERALTIEHLHRRKLAADSGLRLEATVDDEDVRIIAGTMGRFPRFRPIGWEILRTAKVVRDARQN